MIKKADILLALALLLCGLGIFLVFSSSSTVGDNAVITVDGKEYATYSLSQDREISIEENSHTNKITIKNGKVSMNFSDCPGQDCVHQHSISRTGEKIVCLPNKVIIEIVGKNQSYDTISR